MAKFIGVSASEAFCQEVVDACHFEKMVKMDQSRKLPDNIADKINKKAFYRKGSTSSFKVCNLSVLFHLTDNLARYFIFVSYKLYFFVALYKLSR